MLTRGNFTQLPANIFERSVLKSAPKIMQDLQKIEKLQKDEKNKKKIKKKPPEYQKKIVIKKADSGNLDKICQGIQKKMPATFIYPYPPPEELNKAQSSVHQKDYNLGNFHEAIEKYLPHAFDLVNKLQSSPNVSDRTQELHAQPEEKLFNGKTKVIKIDLPGSGYMTIPASHLGYTGVDTIKISKDQEIKIPSNLKESDIRAALEQMKIEQAAKAIMRDGKLYVVRGGVSRNTLQQVTPPTGSGQLYLPKSLQVYTYEELKKIVQFYEKYGNKIKVGNIAGEDVRFKEDEKVIYYTIPGPQALRGTFDWGQYRIKNNSERVDYILKTNVYKTFLNWQNGGDPHDIPIIVRGHSRGAVAAVKGVEKFVSRVWEEYPQYLDKLNLNVILYDPVPGPDSEYRTDEDKDLRERFGLFANTTLISSMVTQHKYFFTPQFLKGFDKLILTPFNHTVGLDKAEEDQGGHFHYPVYKDARTGEGYQETGIIELPRGLYMLEENNVLVELSDRGVTKRITADILKDAKVQKDRIKKIQRMINSWFDIQEQLRGVDKS